MTSWRPDWNAFPRPLLDFWTERHLCTLTTLRADGTPHVVPVGVALDTEAKCAWVITFSTSQKVANLTHSVRVAACQVDGGRWSTIEGTARVHNDEQSVRRAMDQYALRYRQPQPNPLRVAIRIEIERFLGNV